MKSISTLSHLSLHLKRRLIHRMRVLILKGWANWSNILRPLPTGKASKKQEWSGHTQLSGILSRTLLNLKLRPYRPSTAKGHLTSTYTTSSPRLGMWYQIMPPWHVYSLALLNGLLLNSSWSSQKALSRTGVTGEAFPHSFLWRWFGDYHANFHGNEATKRRSS